MNLYRKLSMPYWCVGNPVGDPFGPAVMDRVSSVAVTDILCEAKKDGLIDFTSAHDDDLVTWDPYNENDDTDPKSKGQVCSLKWQPAAFMGTPFSETAALPIQIPVFASLPPKR